MTKVHIVLGVFVITSLGLLGLQAVNNTAKANGNENKTSTPPHRNKVKSFSLIDAAASINGALGADVEPQAPNINHPFPALASSRTLSSRTLSGQAASQATSSTALEGFAALNPVNRSGVRALINVKRAGQTETITGFATNMDPYKAYVSFFYDAGSPGSGPCACISSNPPPAALQSTCTTTQAPPVNFSQMVIGYWMPMTGSSTRSLQVQKTGTTNAPTPSAFVPLENIGAISVREDTQVGQQLPAAPDSNRFQLRACGKFKIDMN